MVNSAALLLKHPVTPSLQCVFLTVPCTLLECPCLTEVVTIM